MDRRTRGKGELRKEAILTAAMQLIAPRVHNRLSLRQIARDIDVDVESIVYYFRTREGFLQALIERWDSDTVVVFEEEPSTGDRLDYFVELVRFNQLTPGLVHLLLTLCADAAAPDHPAHDFVRDRDEGRRIFLRDALRSEQAAGRVPHDVDAEDSARHLIALSHGLQIAELFGSTVTAADGLAAAVSDLRRGVAGGRADSEPRTAAGLTRGELSAGVSG